MSSIAPRTQNRCCSASSRSGALRRHSWIAARIALTIRLSLADAKASSSVRSVLCSASLLATMWPIRAAVAPDGFRVSPSSIARKTGAARAGTDSARSPPGAAGTLFHHPGGNRQSPAPAASRRRGGCDATPPATSALRRPPVRSSRRPGHVPLPPPRRAASDPEEAPRICRVRQHPRSRHARRVRWLRARLRSSRVRQRTHDSVESGGARFRPCGPIREPSSGRCIPLANELEQGRCLDHQVALEQRVDARGIGVEQQRLGCRRPVLPVQMLRLLQRIAMALGDQFPHRGFNGSIEGNGRRARASAWRADLSFDPVRHAVVVGARRTDRARQSYQATIWM